MTAWLSRLLCRLGLHRWRVEAGHRHCTRLTCLARQRWVDDEAAVTCGWWVAY